MKKTFKIIISIVILAALSFGIYFIYTKYYCKLPKGNLTNINNLYKYDIFEKNENVIKTKINGKYLYYLASVVEDDDSLNNYKIVKYDLINNNKLGEYEFNIEDMYDNEIIINDKVTVISETSGDIFILDTNLNLIDSIKANQEKNEKNIQCFGIYNSKSITASKNEIYLDNNLYDTVENECGSVSDILYNKDKVYIYYSDYDTNLSCLYDVKEKSIKHLLSNNIKVFNDGIFYNIYSDSKIYKLKNNVESKINLNNMDEVLNYSIDSSGKYILSSLNNASLNIYDIDENKLNYNIIISSNENDYISNTNIDKYVYFLKNENSKYYFYVWNFAKDKKLDKKLSMKDSVDYKFENFKIINELNEKYDISINAYDSSVRYFNDFYALPEYNDITINEKLLELKEVLTYFNKDFFSKFKLLKNNGVKIYFNKEVAPSDLTTQLANPIAYSTKIGKDYIIAININGSGFEQNFLHELMHTIENNMYDLYNGNKISFYPFENWNDYNPKGFEYEYSYVTEASDKYTTSYTSNVYFVDTYAKKYATEDRARIFEHVCDNKNDNILLQYPNLKKKMIYLKNSIVKAYPSMSDSKLFDNLK